jgi:hypothetical protein
VAVTVLALLILLGGALLAWLISRNREIGVVGEAIVLIIKIISITVLTYSPLCAIIGADRGTTCRRPGSKY